MPKQANLNGWIHLHRKMLDWEWADDPATFCVFLHLLLLACNREGAWRGTLVPRGSLITGSRSLAKSTGLTRQSVRTALEHLKSTHEITIEPTRNFSLIKINKWADYQDLSPQTNPRLTHDQPTPNHIVRRREGEKERRDTERVAENAPPAPTPKDEARRFFTDPEARQPIIDWMADKGVDPTTASRELDRFVAYWTEPTPNGKRQRWELEKAFEIKRRLVTWLGRASRTATSNPCQSWRVAE